MTAIRIFVACALTSVIGFFAAGATAGATSAVIIGAIGLFAAGAAFVAVIDTEPGTPRSRGRRRRRTHRTTLGEWQVRP